jgi:hypothetical protein
MGHKMDARSLPLSPSDYVFCGENRYPVTFLFWFEKRQDFRLMKASLVETLEQFFPLKGRLVESGDSYLIEEDISSPLGSAEFVETEVSAFPDREDSNAMLKLAVPVDHSIGQSLARFKLVQGPQGSLLSASISHGVADGFSSLLFLVSWAGRSRGVMLPPPVHNREILTPRDTMFGDLSADAVLRRTGFTMLEGVPQAPAAEEYEEIFFDNDMLSRERAQAESEIGHKVSRNEIVTALTLKHCAEAWHRPGDRIRLNSAVDMRRFIPELTPFFFGNAVRGSCFEVSYEEIMQFPIGRFAAQIHGINTQIGRPEIDDSLRCLHGLRITGGLKATKSLHVWHPSRGLLVTNLTRLPLNEVNFGLGAASSFYIHSGSRAAIVLPGVNGDRVLIGLPPKQSQS